MNKFRIGNDIPMKWTVTRGGEPEDLTRVAVKKVYIVCPTWKKELSFTIGGDDNNEITALFEGKDQKHCGKYHLLLEENPGESNMNVVESKTAFMLRPVTETGAIEPSGTTEMTTDIMMPSNGLSAYEMAVLKGFIGSEDDWLHQFQSAVVVTQNDIDELIDTEEVMSSDLERCGIGEDVLLGIVRGRIHAIVLVDGDNDMSRVAHIFKGEERWMSERTPHDVPSRVEFGYGTPDNYVRYEIYTNNGSEWYIYRHEVNNSN